MSYQLVLISTHAEQDKAALISTLKELNIKNDAVSLSIITPKDNQSLDHALTSKSIENIDAFILGTASTAENSAYIDELRCTANLFYLPIFTVNSSAHNSTHNQSAYIDAIEHLPASIENLAKDRLKRQAFKDAHWYELEKRVASYLFYAPWRELSVEKQDAGPQYYSYPLLKLWGKEDTQQALFFLGQAKQAYIIEPSKLIDRTRACRQCHSERLNFIDSCKSCGSIDIQLEQAIHCFACGNIGNEKLYQRENKLECPNCLTQLRHIGTDYDRPIENIRCNSCQTLSVGSEARTHCYDCDHDNAIDELVVSNFYQYKLGNRGQELAEEGLLSRQSTTHVSEAVPLEQLAWLISWLLSNSSKQSTTDDTQNFLFRLSIKNFNELLSAHTEQSLQEFIAEFRDRISKLLQDENTQCFVNQKHLLILFADTQEEKLSDFRQSISDIAEQSTSSPLEIEAVAYDLIDDNKKLKSNPSLTAQWLKRICDI